MIFGIPVGDFILLMIGGAVCVALGLWSGGRR